MYDYIAINQNDRFYNGDKIVCVDNDRVGELKINKIYIACIGFEMIRIVNYKDYPIVYKSYRFILLKEYRKQKINQLKKCSK